MDNNEHYKYMPKAPGTEPEVPQPTRQAEEPPVTEAAPQPLMEMPEPGRLHIRKQQAAAAVAAEKEPAEEAESAIFPIIYGIFSPVMVPTYVALFVFLLSILAILVPGAATSYTVTVFAISCIVPMVALSILMKTGVVKSFRMLSRRERVVPYIVEFFALGAVALFLIFKGAYAWIWTIYIGAAAVALTNLLINVRMRISNHCSAMGALLASLLVINNYGFPQVSLFWWVVGTLFFAGVVGSIAMTYGRHSLWEVLAGYATGFLGVILFSMIH